PIFHLRPPAENGRVYKEHWGCPESVLTLFRIQQSHLDCGPGWRRRSPSGNAPGGQSDQGAGRRETAQSPAPSGSCFDKRAQAAGEPAPRVPVVPRRSGARLANSSIASRDLLADSAAPTAGLARNPESRARSLRDPARLALLSAGPPSEPKSAHSLRRRSMTMPAAGKDSI